MTSKRVSFAETQEMDERMHTMGVRLRAQHRKSQSERGKSSTRQPWRSAPRVVNDASRERQPSLRQRRYSEDLRVPRATTRVPTYNPVPSVGTLTFPDIPASLPHPRHPSGKKPVVVQEDPVEASKHHRMLHICSIDDLKTKVQRSRSASNEKTHPRTTDDQPSCCHGSSHCPPPDKHIDGSPDAKARNDTEADVLKGDLTAEAADHSVKTHLKNFNLTLKDSLGRGKGSMVALNYSAAASQRLITEDIMRMNMRKETLQQKQIERIEHRLEKQRLHRLERARQMELAQAQQEEEAERNLYKKPSQMLSLTPRRRPKSLLPSQVNNIHHSHIRRRMSAQPSITLTTNHQVL